MNSADLRGGPQATDRYPVRTVISVGSVEPSLHGNLASNFTGQDGYDYGLTEDTGPQSHT
jgi:hypothetical protein